METDTDTTKTDDYYARLGLSKEASADDINNAFRKLSRIFHPDKHTSSPEKSSDAQRLFTKLKEAHEVLSDPNKRAIYDTMGIKGLQTDGWEVVARTKTPQEIREEYERLQQQREEHRLQRLTNPRGTVGININATDLFDSYSMPDEFFLPSIEITGMSISQSVEAPLTSKDTVELSGELGNLNGDGSGTLTTTYRRVTSYWSWVETDVSVGSENSIALRGFRKLWGRIYATMSGSLQFTPQGMEPVLSTAIGTQLDKGLGGRIVWTAGEKSSMQTTVRWNHEGHNVNAVMKLGLTDTFASLRYSYHFHEHECKVNSCVRAGIFGVTFEYGCDKTITQFSQVGATMVIGNACGVILRIKLVRGKQNYVGRISLSDYVTPAAIFYGTVVPVVSYFVIKKLLLVPFLKDQKEKEVQAQKDANAQQVAKDKRDAEAAVELMTETVERSISVEEKKGGLVIRKALYGKLVKNNEDISDAECINVSKPLQALVANSDLHFVGEVAFSELPGFYDPCIGEDKELSITYEFRRKMHFCRVPDKSALHIPARAHMCDNQASIGSGSGDGLLTDEPSTSTQNSSDR